MPPIKLLLLVILVMSEIVAPMPTPTNASFVQYTVMLI